MTGLVAVGRGLLVGGCDPPRGGECLGQGRLLVVQLDGAVAHPSWLDEHDLRVRPEEVGGEVLFGDQPRQPRLHAVEGLPPGQALPVGAPPGLGRFELGGPGGDRRGRWHLPTAEHHRAPEGCDGALVADVEGGQAVDLVAEEVDANRGVGGRGEDVDDPAAHRQLATVLDLVLTPVALPDQLGDEFLGVDALALDQGDRGGGVAPGAEPLEDGPDRGDDDVGARCTLGEEVPQHREPGPHGGHLGAHPLEGEGLPRREDHDPLAQPTGRRGVGLVRGEEAREVPSQPLGVGERGGDHHERPALREPEQPGDDEGLGGTVDRQGGVG